MATEEDRGSYDSGSCPPRRGQPLPGGAVCVSRARAHSVRVPVGYGACAESPACDLPWRLTAGDCLTGFNSVSWAFNSAARSSGPVCEAAVAVWELPGSSGRLSPCFPDE